MTKILNKYFGKIALLFCLPALILTTGCEATKQMNNRDKGVAIGTAAGAVLGAVIGNNTGDKNNSSLGAILGAVVGGAAGGIIGNKMDKQAQRIEQEIPGAVVERVGEGINVTFTDNGGAKGGVHFDFNSDALTAASIETLKKLTKILNDYPDTNILIEGHTDSKGSDEYNLKLSERRANTVFNHFKNNNIATTRLSTKFYGEAQPIVDNETEENRAKNRRVELVITANQKMQEEAKKQAAQ